MFKFQTRNAGYQQLPRDEQDAPDSESEAVFHTFEVENDHGHKSRPIPFITSRILPWRARRPLHAKRKSYPGRHLRLFVRLAIAIAVMLTTLVILTPVLIPSYTYRPAHYTGTNPNDEKVFIAANIVDEHLIRGAWGEKLLELIDVLGEDNVFLSIYENDSGPGTKAALIELGQKVKCNSSIVSGHIELSTFPSIQFLPNTHHHRRIQYLAEVRNRALRPLDGSFQFNITAIGNETSSSQSPSTDPIILPTFDKLLFLNDIVFSPQDAADLLFATAVDSLTGRTTYHAACAMDFINPFKFYDTFATRDADGYSPGVPFYPWFSARGTGTSRTAVLSQSDAVPVRSCWGGMAAFEARWFQPNLLDGNTRPLRFRAEEELFWESSECCLIHADLESMAERASSGGFSHDQEREWEGVDRGIYVNPYIRVAYSARSQAWLRFTRRFERLYTVPHWVVNKLAGLPLLQQRRTEEAGDKVHHLEWMYDGPELPIAVNQTVKVDEVGHWKEVRRVARPGGFCGYRFMLTLKESWKQGEKMWEKTLAPNGWQD